MVKTNNTENTKVETKEVKKVAPTKNTKKEVTKKDSVDKAAKKAKAVVTEKAAPKKREPKLPSVEQFTNSQLRNLLVDNGCLPRGNARDTSNVVYTGFGTQSRILQQKNGYQLLLTAGHKKVKENIVDCDNNDTERFTKWFNKLSKEKKAFVSGGDSILESKLSESELPREKQCKITNKDLLIEFIKYMGTFDENKLVAPTK